MVTHVSLATALDMNRLASNFVYLALLEIDVINPVTGGVVETIYITHNNEPYVFQGNTYLPVPFDFALTQEHDTTPTAQITLIDLGQIIQAALQSYGNALDWPLRLKIVNTLNPQQLVDIQQNFEILGASAKDDNYAITFTLGSENPLTLRFPYRQQFRNRCFWKYKSTIGCKYVGSLPSCSYTKDGDNGCAAHSNTQNFGGFPGLARTIS